MILILERFSLECRKTKTRVITLANHKGHIIKWTNQNTKLFHVADAKCGKTRPSESRLVLVLLLIGWKIGASFLNQSRSEVNAIPITFRHSNENRSTSPVSVGFSFAWEYISNTQTVFDHISKHLEARQKYSRERCIFNAILAVWNVNPGFCFWCITWEWRILFLIGN